MSVGFTSGLGLLVAQVAFGSLIVSGALAPYSSQGVGLVLFGNFAACLILALAGRYRGTIAGLSPALVIVMATIGASVDAGGRGAVRHHGRPAGDRRDGHRCVLSPARPVSGSANLVSFEQQGPSGPRSRHPEGGRESGCTPTGCAATCCSAASVRWPIISGSPCAALRVPACLLLDFSAVSGFDFSAVSVVSRFLQTANAAGVQVVLERSF